MRYNNKSTASTTGGGIGFTGLLTIAFIILKLCNVINWSWWWVLSPLWISTGLALTILIIIFIVLIVSCTVEER